MPGDKFADQTVLHPLGLLAVVVLGAAMLMLPRRYAVFPMLAMACFIAPAQRVSIATLDFTLLRIMIVFGWARLLVRSEFAGLRWQTLDTLMVCWVVSGTAAYTALHGQLAAFVFKAGASFDAIGMYFLFRCLIRNWDDLDRTVTAVVLISVPIALAFAIEHATRRNLFAFFGGVPEITWERDGKLRCQGAFAHAILAGCFWASLAPLIAAQWWSGGRSSKLRAAIGVTMSATIVIACASSTPVMGVLFACVGAVMFPLRRYMQVVRWGVLLCLIGLHMVMKQPVWHLICRIDVVGGSTGYHRFRLIQGAIDFFPEWFLLGTFSTAHWGWHLYDVTNQYVLEGVRGGFLTLALFVAIISVAFRQVGRLRKAVSGQRHRETMTWALGVGLFVHCMNYIAVSYFGQIILVWYLNLAAIASLSTPGVTAAGGALRSVAARGLVRPRRIALAPDRAASNLNRNRRGEEKRDVEMLVPPDRETCA